MLYEMLTGQRPHGAFQPPSHRVHVDVRIDEVVLKALQQEPARRYQQASEMKVDVDRIRSTPPEEVTVAQKLPGKKLLIAGAVILAILAVYWAVHRASLQSPSTPVAASSPATVPQSNPAPPVSTGPGWKPLPAPDAASIQAKSDDGWFQTALWNANQQAPFADGAIRIRTRWTERGWIWIDLRNTSDRLVELKINNLGLVQLIYRYDGQEKGRREMQLPAFKVGQQVTLQFVVVGTTAMARVDDRQLTLPGLLSSWVGSIRIGGGTGATAVWVKPGEYLNLDGMADPLKALGWEVEAVTSSPATATKENPFTNSLGMKFVPIPITGGPTNGQRVLFSVWETRVQDYEVFAKATSTRWGKHLFEQGPTHPAGGMAWDEAKAFCEWLTDRERQAGRISPAEAYRLPTDHEWSCAVGIGAREDAAKAPADKTMAAAFKDIYPWGTSWPPPAGTVNLGGAEKGELHESGREKPLSGLASYRDAFPRTAPVGSFPADGPGLFDLGGNVREWCSDLLAPGSDKRVLRGGAWLYSDPPSFHSSRRDGFPVGGNWRSDVIGFRCVLAPVVSETPQSTSTIPTAATKDAPFVNNLGMKFVPVPITGGPTNGQRVLFSVWHTRVQDYEVFTRETRHDFLKPAFPQGPTHPVVNVSWDDARAFCRWLTERERQAGQIAAYQAYRLPSDHEWSCAIGIGDREDAAKMPAEKNEKISDVYPWGAPWPPPDQAGNYASEELALLLATTNYTNIRDVIAGYRDGYGVTSPVGSYAVNRHGLYDLSGNAWHWCEDWFDSTQTWRVRRGSSWNRRDRLILLSSHREQSEPSARFNAFGFRCVLAPDASALPADPKASGN